MACTSPVLLKLLREGWFHLGFRSTTVGFREFHHRSRGGGVGAILSLGHPSAVEGRLSCGCLVKRLREGVASIVLLHGGFRSELGLLEESGRVCLGLCRGSVQVEFLSCTAWSCRLFAACD